MYPVALDACVLFPNVLRDSLLTLAERELFRPMWSNAILAELRRNVLAKRTVDPASIDRTLGIMTSSFDGAMIDDENWQPLVAGLELPDPDDRHVLAAAIAGGAESIVTFNLKDFPAAKLDPHHIDAVHPDDFMLDQLDLAPAKVLAALSQQAHRYRMPPMDLSGLLTRLERCGVPDFVDEIRRIAAL